jgi:GDP-4-dehydro-6-deoxy-D-mannose reductase
VRVLITGAGGFVGGHLIRHLSESSSEIHGTLHQGLESKTSDETITYHPLDLRDTQAVHDLIREIQPEAIYHLAAQAFVPRSFDDPWETLENNIKGQLNLILGCLKINIKPRLLIVSSAQIYGDISDQPIRESTPPRPSSPYSVSKITQELLGQQYHLSHQLPIMIARPFNHLGPGQNERFVAPNFALQIARIEVGLQEPVMSIGNLEAQRDFTDVRDIVRAYRLIVEHGQPGQIYNVAAGRAYSIQYLLDKLLSYSDTHIEIRIDPERLRPAEIPVIIGDATRLRQHTGWQPVIPFEQSLLDVLNDCRNRVQAEIPHD